MGRHWNFEYDYGNQKFQAKLQQRVHVLIAIHNHIRKVFELQRHSRQIFVGLLIADFKGNSSHRPRLLTVAFRPEELTSEIRLLNAAFRADQIPKSSAKWFVKLLRPASDCFPLNSSMKRPTKMFASETNGMARRARNHVQHALKAISCYRLSLQERKGKKERER